MRFNCKPPAPLDPQLIQLVRTKCQTYRNRRAGASWTQEDSQQEVWLHLEANKAKLVPRDGTGYALYDRAIRNKVINLAEHQNAQKRNAGTLASIDAVPEQADPNDTRHPADRMAIHDAIERMPDVLRRIATLLMSMTPADAMRELKLTRGQFRQRMKEIGEYLADFRNPNSQSHDGFGL